MKPLHGLLVIVSIALIGVTARLVLGPQLPEGLSPSMCDDRKFNCAPRDEVDPFTLSSSYPTVCIDNILYFTQGVGNGNPSTPVLRVIGGVTRTTSTVAVGYTPCGV